MNTISNYTEEIINSYLNYSNRDLSPNDYLLFRQQAIAETCDKRLSKTSNSNITINENQHIQQASKTNAQIEPTVQIQRKIGNNINNHKSVPTVIHANNEMTEDTEDTDSNSSNFWDVINRIED